MSLVNDSLNGGLIIATLATSLLIIMIISSLYFAKRVSQSIGQMNTAMIETAYDNKAVISRSNKDQYLAKTFAAISVFRNTLMANQAQQHSLQKTVDKLQESKTHYHDLLDIVGSPIVVIDELTDIAIFNKAAQSLFNYDLSEIYNQPFFDLIAKDQHFCASNILEFLQSDKSTMVFDEPPIKAFKKSGDCFFLTASIVKQKLGQRFSITNIY